MCAQTPSGVASPKGVGGFEKLVCPQPLGEGGFAPLPNLENFEKMNPILPSFHTHINVKKM